MIRHVRLGLRHRVPLFHQDGWGPGLCQVKGPWGGDCRLGCSGYLGNLETGAEGKSEAAMTPQACGTGVP